MKLIQSLTCLAIILLSAGSSYAELPHPESVGAKLYLQYCSACHGTSGNGNGPVAGSLTKQPADLTKISLRRNGKFPAEEIAAIIDGRNSVAAHGMREMPVWGRVFSEAAGGDSIGEEFSQGNVQTLVEYLRSIQEK